MNKTKGDFSGILLVISGICFLIVAYSNYQSGELTLATVYLLCGIADIIGVICKYNANKKKQHHHHHHHHED